MIGPLLSSRSSQCEVRPKPKGLKEERSGRYAKVSNYSLGVDPTYEAEVQPHLGVKWFKTLTEHWNSCDVSVLKGNSRDKANLGLSF